MKKITIRTPHSLRVIEAEVRGSFQLPLSVGLLLEGTIVLSEEEEEEEVEGPFRLRFEDGTTVRGTMRSWVDYAYGRDCKIMKATCTRPFVDSNAMCEWQAEVVSSGSGTGPLRITDFSEEGYPGEWKATVEVAFHW